MYSGEELIRTNDSLGKHLPLHLLHRYLEDFEALSTLFPRMQVGNYSYGFKFTRQKDRRTEEDISQSDCTRLKQLYSS